ncbi:MAG: S-methyl-5-thioribose-1-phosphate isomerase [Candidatus Aminicenantes bacterium]|nr:S-methyl-5-thioribose-1-phosphate isomerase [Candidatus Aminicenantes bacterium]
MLPTIAWKDDRVIMIDQRRLPFEEVYVECRRHEEVAEAIEKMIIRGAPAIGVAAAFGVALGALNIKPGDGLEGKFEEICERLSRTRPTARNLFWALERMKRAFAAAKNRPLAALQERLIGEALAIEKEDIETNKKIGQHGKRLIKCGASVLTHCNAGGLATAGYGTAIGVIRAAHEEGKKIHVFVDETRPFLQGARLTAWELEKLGIPLTLITDSMAGWLMKKGEVDAVLVGADRIARNGDAANKIGSYSLAVLARHHGIPFYVAAPLNTFDFSIAKGEDIPIEERPAGEVREAGGRPITLPHVRVRNPAFDVVPGRFITAIVSEQGIARPPYRRSLAFWRKRG